MYKSSNSELLTFRLVRNKKILTMHKINKLHFQADLLCQNESAILTFRTAQNQNTEVMARIALYKIRFFLQY